VVVIFGYFEGEGTSSLFGTIKIEIVAYRVLKLSQLQLKPWISANIPIKPGDGQFLSRQ